MCTGRCKPSTHTFEPCCSLFSEEVAWNGGCSPVHGTMLSGWESVGNQAKGEGARKGSRSVLPRFTDCLNSSFIWGAVNIRARWTACVCFLWRVRNRLRTNCQLWTQSAIRNKKKGPWSAQWNPPWASILLLVKDKLQFPSCTIAASEVDANGWASQREALKTKLSLPLPQWPGQLEWFPPPFSLPPKLHGECKRQESWVLAHLATNMITMAKYQLGWLAMGSWDVLFYLFHQPSVSWGKCLQSHFIGKLRVWIQPFWGCLVPASSSCLFRQGASGLAPRRGLASTAVIYTIYLFLALRPLANCMSLCWISLEFNHALFSFQLNYLYIWLTFSLPGRQIFSETTNKHRPIKFQAGIPGDRPVCWVLRIRCIRLFLTT